MRIFLTLFLAAGLLPAADSWIPLFDGRTLAGWQVKAKAGDRSKQFWKAADGTIACDSIGRKDHDYVWLVNDREFGDFDLRLSVQGFADSPGNAGVQIRSRYDDEAGWMNGPQADIHPPAPWRTGLIYDETRETRRWIFPSLKDWNIETSQGPKQWKWNAEGWNDLLIVCRGPRIRTVVNGITIADFDGAGILDDDAHRRHNVGLNGHVALQLHSRDELRIRFKDIQARPAR